MSFRSHLRFVTMLVALSDAAGADELPDGVAAGLGTAAVTAGAVLLSGAKSNAPVISTTSSPTAGGAGSMGSAIVSGVSNNNAGSMLPPGGSAGTNADDAAGVLPPPGTAGGNANNAGGMLSPGGAAGGSIFTGAGSISLNGSNSYAGGAVVDAGTVIFDLGGSVSALIATGTGLISVTLTTTSGTTSSSGTGH